MEVHDFYLDLEKFAVAHPLIVEVGCKESYKRCYLYSVKEKPFPWLGFSIDYIAEIENPIYLHKIIYKISDVPFLWPTISYDFVDLKENGTEITVQIDVEGSWVFRRFLAKKMMRAQRKLMDNWINQ